MSRWVCTQVVKQPSTRERARCLRLFIELAAACRELGNFNGLMEIVAALNSAALHRLRRVTNHDRPRRTNKLLWFPWRNMRVQLRGRLRTIRCSFVQQPGLLHWRSLHRLWRRPTIQLNSTRSVYHRPAMAGCMCGTTWS